VSLWGGFEMINSGGAFEEGGGGIGRHLWHHLHCHLGWQRYMIVCGSRVTSCLQQCWLVKL